MPEDENDILHLVSDEASQRILAAREARDLLLSLPGTELEVSAIDIVSVATWYLTGRDPWSTTPVRDQVELEAAAEAVCRNGQHDGAYVAGLPGDLTRHVGCTFVGGSRRWTPDDESEDDEDQLVWDRAEDRAQVEADSDALLNRPTPAVVTEHRVGDGPWQPGPLPSEDATKEHPAVTPFDSLLGAPDQQDRRAWS